MIVLLYKQIKNTYMENEQEKGLILQHSLPIEALDFNKKVVEFVAALNTPPDGREVKINKFADNSKFLPIQVVEDKLNYFFGGLWQTRNFKYQVIVNELAADLELGIYHPVLKQWIWRSGAGGTQIQLKAEYETMPDGKRRKKAVDVLDVSKKIANTLQKDLPHVKAECLKNAAKSFGRAFGAALNRDMEDTGSQLDNVQDIEGILIMLGGAETYDELKAVFADLPPLQQKDKRVTNLFAQKSSTLKQKK